MGTTYTCLIVDDEKPAHQVLMSHISQCEDLECVGNAFSGREALAFLQKHEVDILLLDINMPLISGLELLDMVAVKPVTIITTAYSDFALESYEKDAVDYLLKPISFGKFLKAIEKAKIFCKNRRESTGEVQENILKIREDGLDISIDVDEIIFIESAGNYIKIFVEHRSKSYFVYGSLISIKTELPDHFIQVHRSFIVNRKQIVKKELGKVTLHTNIEIPVGRKYQILIE
ncbi:MULTISPECIES: LytTR family DNA-binding domain-containing protein [unclassified Myroides]|uniref:LytR/AlgR family response regulator transcription factor n=1 Tax=unclassified Myroides TaxID=2642485 RepID=UPI0015F8844C|nr:MULTISPECIES: LytTR family DNA-binding domain-containing protein [unclassified Myroides]MBB1150411.1 response regulator transcription factor [Myroides sp. NP-2]MDM1407349.1 response regulator transcription factor [Myroides sp. DF42-4-2]